LHSDKILRDQPEPLANELVLLLRTSVGTCLKDMLLKKIETNFDEVCNRKRHKYAIKISKDAPSKNLST